MNNDDNVLSEPVECVCECCNKEKVCRMYLLQDGHAAFVCDECRKGT